MRGKGGQVKTIPAPLIKEKERLNQEYDQAYGVLMGIGETGGGANAEALLGHLRRLRDEKAALKLQIAQVPIKHPTVQLSEPLNFAEASQALEPGTVLLAYSIDSQTTNLFVINSTRDLYALSLPIGEQELRARVKLFRRSIIDSRSPQDVVTGDLFSQSRALYDALILPAEIALKDADRVLILPDGPLHFLPFTALASGNTDTQDEKHNHASWSYLVESLPLHKSLSVSLYSQLLRKDLHLNMSREGKHLVAFGDPSYQSDSSKPRVLGAGLPARLGRSLRFADLPGSRKEVEAIAALFGDKAVVYLGDAATEEQAKRSCRDAQYLHFACHSLLNDDLPLSSGLVLSLSEGTEDGRNNGILQAWEILEQLEVKAEMVVLSACDSGLGADSGGEGIIGLTNAFLASGAPSVVSSLWPISDQATTEFMLRFYQELVNGSRKDEALRAAQLQLLRGDPALTATPTAAPYYWAAFQLIGSGR